MAGNSTGVKYSENPREIVNLSVWQTSADLEHHVWNKVHRHFMNRHAERFVPIDQPYFVLWWVPVDVLPTLAEALDRLACLRSDGPSAHAFGWSNLPGQRIWDQP